MRFAAFKELTRLEQTFFALPFVLAAGMVGWLPSCSTQRTMSWLYIIPAFLLARISGMAFNQLIDRDIDARNPRTEKRAIPSGRVSVKQARFVAWGALCLFLLLCMQINTLTALLSPIAAFLLFIYSYMKRIHPSCHFVLGLIHFLGPIMAYAAITGHFSWAAVFLGGVASSLIIGTDIVYAVQDYDYDCKHGLFSIPSRLGLQKSFVIASFMHFICLLFLGAVGFTLSLPFYYYFIIPLVGLNFFYFHLKMRMHIERHGSLKAVESSFFFCNVAASFSSLLFVTLSLL